MIDIVNLNTPLKQHTNFLKQHTNFLKQHTNFLKQHTNFLKQHIFYYFKKYNKKNIYNKYITIDTFLYFFVL